MKTKPPKGPSEAEFTRQVLQLAKLCGWRTLHIRPGRTATGWRTPVQGDGKGFVDIFAVHRGRGVLLFAELKVDGRLLTLEQDEWLSALRQTDAIVRAWTPDDWPEIEAILRGD